MNTKIIMTSSALFLAALGILLSFMPTEVALYLDVAPNSITILFIKICSAFYMGFGILNWMAKETLIGGIYNRPIALGNAMHFGVVTAALVKIIPTLEKHSEIIIALTIVYGIFTVLFAYIFKTNPAKVEKAN